MAYICSTCKREIINPYYLDGKIYGHECYKMAVTLKYAHLEQMKNDDYSKKCVALIETFRNKQFKDKWNQDFQTSILNQWDLCNKLTAKQFDLITKKFNQIEYINYNFLYLELQEDDKKVQELINQIYTYIIKDNKLMRAFKDNEQFINVIKQNSYLGIKRGYKYSIVEYKDIDESEIMIQIIKEDGIEDIKNDEYMEIISIREV